MFNFKSEVLVNDGYVFYVKIQTGPNNEFVHFIHTIREFSAV